MLNVLRKKKVAKRILIVLATLIVPAFVLWGVGNISKRRIAGFTYIGIIDGKKIRIEDFANAKRGMEIQIIINYFAQREILDKLLKDRELMNKLTWDRLVMLSEAHKAGIEVSDSEVVGFITSHPLFVHNGAFDEKFYNYMLNSNLGISPRTFEEEIRDALRIAKLKDDILKEVSVIDEEVLNAYKNENEQGKISYAIIEKQKFINSIVIKDEEINDFYNKFKDNFKTHEKISLEYIEFPYTNYDERDILFGKVKDISKKLKKNKENFSLLAKELNFLVKEIEPFSEENLPYNLAWDSNFYNTLFDSQIGDIHMTSSEAPQGFFYIVRIKEKIPSTISSKEDATPSIREILVENKADALSKKEADEILAIVQKENASLEKAPAPFNLAITKTAFFTRFSYVEGVGEAHEILDKVFLSAPGTVSGPFKIRKGYVIVRLDELKPIDEEKYKEEKENFKNKVLAVKKTKALNDWLTSISSQAHTVVDLKLL